MRCSLDIRCARAVGNAAAVLHLWRLQQPHPRGQIFVNVEYRPAAGAPPSVLDVAYVGPMALARQTAEPNWLEAPPSLVVNVPPANESKEEWLDRIAGWHALGIPCIWIIDTAAEVVRVHPNGAPPSEHRRFSEFDGGREMPGLLLTAFDLVAL